MRELWDKGVRWESLQENTRRAAAVADFAEEPWNISCLADFHQDFQSVKLVRQQRNLLWPQIENDAAGAGRKMRLGTGHRHEYPDGQGRNCQAAEGGSGRGAHLKPCLETQGSHQPPSRTLRRAGAAVGEGGSVEGWLPPVETDRTTGRIISISW